MTVDLGGAQLVRRSEWGARAPRSRTSMTPTYGTTVHWEGPHMGPFEHDRCPAKVRAVQDYHMDTQGWSDVAYTALVCPHGWVYEGRWVGTRTAANGTTAGNDHAYALCYLSGEGDPFTGQAQQALRVTLDWLDTHGSAGPGRNCHRDWKPTACPGDAVCTWVRAGQPVPAPAPVPPALSDTGGDLGMDGIFHGGLVHVFNVRDDGALVERFGDPLNPTGHNVIMPPGWCQTGAEARVKVVPVGATYGVAALRGPTPGVPDGGDVSNWAYWTGSEWVLRGWD